MNENKINNYNNIILYYIILYYIILYYTILYYVMLCYVMLYYIILYYIILYYIILYYIILYYIILYRVQIYTCMYSIKDFVWPTIFHFYFRRYMQECFHTSSNLIFFICWLVSFWPNTPNSY